MLCIFLLTLFLSFSWIEPEGLYNLNSPQYLQVSSVISNSKSSDSELKVLTGKSLNGNENKKQNLQSATAKKIDTSPKFPHDFCTLQCTLRHLLEPIKINSCVQCCKGSGGICEER